jgi:hypothetical protein
MRALSVVTVRTRKISNAKIVHKPLLAISLIVGQPFLREVGPLYVPGPLDWHLPLTAHVENPKVIAASTETPRGQRPDAVRAHGAQSHWSYRLHRERGDFRVDPSDESSCEDGGVEIWTREHSSYRADFEPNQLDGDFHRS